MRGDGASARDIALTLGVARSTVQDNLKRAAATGLSWPLPGELTDDTLAGRLFARAGVKPGMRRRPEPNWAELVVELKKPGVTLLILWEEYRAVHPGGYGYSRFCDLFRGFERRLSPTMRQDHVAGDKVFVDYSGKKIAIVDPLTGEIREAEIFVAVLGASNFTYAEATWTQTLPDWIGAHVRMFRFFGGVPRLIVPDNLKSGVNQASFYDPEINRSYGMMASHYGVGVLPARPKRPKDKAKVENGVRFAQTCILGRLRRQTFFSLAEANAAIADALDRINDHVMRRLGVSRRHLFQTVGAPALASLPAEDYEYAEWRLARVGTYYHVEFESFFCSVPHGVIRQQVEVRTTAATIEIFHRGKRVAAHQRRYGGARHGTNPDHMAIADMRNGHRSAPSLGRLGRAADRGADRRHSGQPPAPGARLQNMSGRAPPVPRDRPCPRRDGLGPGHRDRRAHLHEHRLDPGQPSGRKTNPRHRTRRRHEAIDGPVVARLVTEAGITENKLASS